jgi:hypothetical protein
MLVLTHFQIADWVADAVLSKEDSRRRAAIVKQFISVADVSFSYVGPQHFTDLSARSDAEHSTTTLLWLLSRRDSTHHLYVD